MSIFNKIALKLVFQVFCNVLLHISRLMINLNMQTEFVVKSARTFLQKALLVDFNGNGPRILNV